MEKLYGFKEEDLIGLNKTLIENRTEPLSKIFSIYAEKSGKQKGTVRNLYYSASKKCIEDKAFCKRYFNGIPPTVTKIKPFTEKETQEIVKKILLKKNEGKSVRKAVHELSNGDVRLALRYQNKYRNSLDNKKLLEKLKAQRINVTATKRDNGLEKLKEEVNGLVEKISIGLRKENEYLKEKVSALQTENVRLLNLIDKK